VSDSDKRSVRLLGETIGYGRVMELCENLSVGALSVGPSTEHLVPCPCIDTAFCAICEWCCGSHRVTKRVAQAMGADEGSRAKTVSDR
jgi:hypothetical protein